jgi:LPS-assembly protein
LSVPRGNVRLAGSLRRKRAFRAFARGAIAMAHHSTGIRRWIVSISALLLAVPAALAAAQLELPAGGGVVRLEARQQRKQGQVFTADGDVEISYRGVQMRADHVEYNAATAAVVARGHVQFDYGTQHLEADRAEYNVRSGRGRFEHVRGEVRIQRQPNPSVLVTPNPLSFEAESVERLSAGTYRISHGWLTVCDPRHPKWTFGAREATLEVGRKVILLHANFRLFHIPLLYVPYATAPAGRRVRQSGFLVPEVANNSVKGFVVGDAYYWAPTEWADATVGAQFLSRRGWSQSDEVRLRPWENVSLSGSYFGVEDRLEQGGHTVNFRLDAALQGGWRAVADVTELSSLTFRLAFSPTFGEAVNSEVQSTGFVTNNFDGFSINFAANNYKNFLSAQPETAVVLRRAPQVQFGSVDRAPWKRWPFYFGFDAFTGAVYRSDPLISTPPMVQRSEFAPRVTVPVHWGDWLGVTPTFTFRATRYGASRDPATGAVVDQPVKRVTGEINVDARPPTLERIWGTPDSKWKHTIEPEVVYRYVTGVNNFGTFLRFDENDTLTDTNEVEYSITQRLFHRNGTHGAQVLLSWRLAQKYYFDPTFGGAIVPGQRNVVQALDSITPFAFADGPRRFSPLVSDFTISPGGRYDAEFLTDYDPALHRITAQESLIKFHPRNQLELTIAHYALVGDPVLQPHSDQIRALIGYGELNRRGWNGELGFSYDFRQGYLQNEVAQVSYNGSCCGIAFEYRRLALGQLRRDNQFRVALTIANIGTFGNLRRREKIF